MELLEARLIPDQLFADAYAATEPSTRGLIKSAIARLLSLHSVGVHSGISGAIAAERRTRSWEQGFISSESTRPADWALICLDNNFASPARLLAALVPALLSGVPRLAVVHMGVSPWPAPLLAALELAGQELACSADSAELCAWIEALHAQGPGRCLFLGSEFGDAPATALRLDIPVFFRRAAPRIGVSGAQGAAARLANLAHPDAELLPLEECGAKSLDAIICDSAEVSNLQDRARQVFSTEHAFCWLYPELDGWFSQRAYALWNRPGAESSQ